MKLQDVVNQPGKLPTIPKLGQQLVASFSDEDANIDDIARQINADPALSAKLLRLANSAYFHVSRTVGTVQAALQMLGFIMVRNLVLGSSVASAFPKVPGVELKQFWRYSLYTACVARWLAPRVRVNADMVFTLGLLHAVGQLQLHVVSPQALTALDRRVPVLEPTRAAAERDALGYDYTMVSAELARIWNFPAPMSDILRVVAQPLESEDWSVEAGVLHLAAWRARADVLGWDESTCSEQFPHHVAQRLGVEPELFQGAVADTSRSADTLPPLPELTDGMESMFE